MADLKLLQEGPFPNHIDPWAEQGRYFHPLHEQMIGYLLDQTQEPLFAMGYVVGRETSLQIAEKHLPDMYVQTLNSRPPESRAYSETATALDLETGVALDTEEPEIDAFVVRSFETGDLVTILEIISPSNKTDLSRAIQYQSRRQALLERGVHVVEIDFTRSLVRLVNHSLAKSHPYHIVIHLHNEAARFIGMTLMDSPKRFGLPLIGEAIAIDLNNIYREAYAKTLLSWRIQNERRYSVDSLPFPSTLSQAEQDYLTDAVKQWQAKL